MTQDRVEAMAASLMARDDMTPDIAWKMADKFELIRLQREAALKAAAAAAATKPKEKA